MLTLYGKKQRIKRLMQTRYHQFVCFYINCVLLHIALSTRWQHKTSFNSVDVILTRFKCVNMSGLLFVDIFLVVIITNSCVHVRPMQ